MAIDDRIKKIEDEIQKTPYNKATSHHIGKLKAKLSRLKEESLQRSSSGVKGKGFHIPGIITGASKGKGRGKEILSVSRNSDLIVVVLDVFNPQHLPVILDELRNIGIRPNESMPDVTVKKKKMGGINLSSTIPLTKIDDGTIRSILNEYGIHSADVLIRDDVSIDQFIDALDPNCRYSPMLLVINKVDLADVDYLKKLKSNFPDALYVAADQGYNMDLLRERIFQQLELIRIFLKPQGRKADLEEPLIVRKESTVEEVALKLHRDFVRNFRQARVWGTSVKFPGQKVGLEHHLQDQDVLRLIIKK
jgi:hypothetical protein